MKMWKALSIVSLVVAWSGAALAQDAVKVDPAHYKVVFENASVRVLRISYAPGGKSVMHQHPDSIVISLSASKVKFTTARRQIGGQRLGQRDRPLYTPAGTHNPRTSARDLLMRCWSNSRPRRRAKRRCRRPAPAWT